VLGAVFHTAVRAGRRARTETGICRCPMSVSSEAVRALRETGWEPERSRVLVVGTGKMSRLAGEVLRAHGVRDLRIIGRTAARAESVARALDATPLAWHLFDTVLRDVDVAFCATSAPHAVVTRDRVAAARSAVPADQSLRFIDIAVPRDVEPAVRTLPGVSIFDLDDLQRRLARNLDGRRREVPAVEALVEEEVRSFEDWRHGAELHPLLAAMHQHSEAIRQREVARALRRMKGCTPEMEEHIHAFSRSLVNKLLHAPTRRLREETDPDRCDAYVRAARDLFGLGAGAPGDRTAAPEDAKGCREESAA
jgi:glutamyl-tRNA reductase